MASYPNINVKIFAKIVHGLEYYFIPICASLGFIANTIGSICLLREKQLRKSTTNFILAVIGLFDTCLLFTQVQRWLAIFVNPIFINTGVFCKLYFLFLRLSLMSTSSLFLAVLVIKFIRYYYGGYKLSIKTSVGQMCSKLCVVYITAMTVSVSMFDIWTSGTQTKPDPILSNLNLEFQLISFLESNLTIEIGNFTSNHEDTHDDNEDVKCIENVHFETFIGILKYFNWVIMLMIFLAILIFSVFLCFKVISNDSLLKVKAAAARKHRQSIMSVRSTIDALYEQDSMCSADLAHDRNELKIRRFLRFLIQISFSCVPFDVLFILIDFSGVYEYVHVDHMTKKIDKKSLLRIVFCCLVLAHSTKFFYLFVYDQRFRTRVCHLLNVKFYLNRKVFRKRRSDSFRFPNRKPCAYKYVFQINRDPKTSSKRTIK